MTDRSILEDTIARADYWLAQEREDDYSLEGSVTYDLVRDLTAALRAAGVVPAEPANHDPWPKFCPICLAEFHADGTVTPAAAAVDGEAPAT